MALENRAPSHATGSDNGGRAGGSERSGTNIAVQRAGSPLGFAAGPLRGGSSMIFGAEGQT